MIALSASPAGCKLSGHRDYSLLRSAFLVPDTSVSNKVLDRWAEQLEKAFHCVNLMGQNSPWSRVASACNSLKHGLGSWPEAEAGSRQCKHQILAIRPVISNKDPSALQKRIPTKMESSEICKVFTWRKRVQHVSIDTRTDSESPWVTLSWQFELALWDIFSRFSLANHFDFPGSLFIFGIFQDCPMGAHTSLSQTGFHVWSGRSPDFMRNMWSGQGPASSLIVLLVSSRSFSPQGMNL